jgi:eukaryotic-like serine/threonine-protein kinase
MSGQTASGLPLFSCAPHRISPRFRSPSKILENLWKSSSLAMNAEIKNFYVFGPFRIDPEERVLVRDGIPIPLGPKVFETLLLLVKNAGHLIDKDELMKRVWPDAFVEEGNLNKHIFVLRKTLGQWDGGVEYIETVPRRGYRFVAPVVRLGPEEKSNQVAASTGANLIGNKVSHYRVLELLGGGGMGLIYRAEDLKLGRRVALKFLPEELARDSVALERFEREARAASALNHPNICTIYAIEEYEKQPFIAMELLQGETLRELISSARTQPKSGGSDVLPLRDLIDIAIQISEGLEAAHRTGIIHRDIKPANIFVTSLGQAKILDFGLAKLEEWETTEPQLSAIDEHQPKREWDPNLTLTRTGMTIGTAGYMSPEQVRGEKLDVRTDLFSFGMVLYEMATGQRAFAGDTAPVLREAIVNHTPPPVRQLNNKIPAKLERIINKALEKNRESRYQTASLMRVDLEDLRRETEPSHFIVRRSVLAVSISALLAVIISVSLWVTRRQPASPLELKQRQLTANSSENAVVSGAISPDGRNIAYADRQGIHIKTIDTGEVNTVPEPTELKGFEVNWAIVPTWPRDSTTLVANVTIPGQPPSIWTVPMIGGQPHKIRDNAFAYTLSRDGSWLAFMPTPNKFGLGHQEMWLMRANGSGAHKLYEADQNTAFIGAEWSPDGARLAYNMLRETPDRSEIFIQTRDLKGGNSATAVTGGTSDWSWSPDGRLIYGLFDRDLVGDSCNFWATPVDAATGKPNGPARKLTNWAGFCMDDLSETADGKRLLFRKWSWQGSVYVSDLVAGGTQITQPRRLTLNEGRNFPGAWTADSKSIVFGSYVDGRWKILKQSLAEETSEPVTTQEEGDVKSGRVSPDGAWILYVLTPNANAGSLSLSRLMRVRPGGGPPELVLTAPLYSDPQCAHFPSTLCVIAEPSKDNRQLIFTAFDAVNGRGRELIRCGIDNTADLNYVWDLSPDGTRIAVLKYSAAKIEVFPLNGRPRQEILAMGWKSLESLHWAADGKGFFVSGAADGGSALLLLDLRGQAHVLWKQKGSIAPWNVPLAHRWGPSAPWAIPSPDGRHLAIYNWNFSANMWMIENF